MKKGEKKDKFLDLTKELKKTVSDGDTNFNWHARYYHPRIGTGGLKGRVETIQASVVEIGLNAKKNPGDLRRLAVTQTPVENHQLTLVCKTPKWVK